MTAPGCGDPAACPVPAPRDVDLRRLTSTIWPKELPLRRGHRTRHRPDEPAPAAAGLPPADQVSRFAPVLGQPHSYVARRAPAALLESVLHDLVPARPRIPWRRLDGWSLSHVTLTRDVRLIDLRDPALTELGLDRGALVATAPAHYPCTRQWAERLHHHRIGSQPTYGLLWHSRQAELHAIHGTRPLLQDILVGEQAEVAVLWPTARRRLLAASGHSDPLHTGRGRELMTDVANLLGAPPPLTGPGTH